MEKKKAYVYFVYRLSYDRNLPGGIPIYKYGQGQDPNFYKPVAYSKENLFEDRQMIPKIFETEKDAELAKAELEKIGIFTNWKVERLIHHIELDFLEE